MDIFVDEFIDFEPGIQHVFLFTLYNTSRGLLSFSLQLIILFLLVSSKIYVSKP